MATAFYVNSGQNIIGKLSFISYFHSTICNVHSNIINSARILIVG